MFFGSGMVDVAWFLGGCLPVALGEHEMSLLRHYHQTFINIDDNAATGWLRETYRCYTVWVDDE